MQYSLDMAHVQNVEAEITWPSILTKAATVLAANSPAKEAVLALMQQNPFDVTITHFQGVLTLTLNGFLYQKIVSLLTDYQLLHGYNHALSLLKPVSVPESNGAPHSNNSSSPTMTTKRKSFAALKPVTLTVTGKLKPNILTVEQLQESYKSTRIEKNPTIQPNLWELLTVPNAVSS